MGRKKSMNNKTSDSQVSEVLNQEDAESIASSYFSDTVNTVFVTTDKNVFFKENEGAAESHRRKHGLKIFKVNK
jgi:hypothetical protein